MPTLTRMQVRQKILKWAFVVYAVCSLLSMATMSVGAAFLFLAILVSIENFSEWKKEAARLATKHYLFWAVFLFTAAIVSLLGAKYFPLQFSGQSSEVHLLRDLSKSWYFFWPFILVIGLRRLKENDHSLILKSWIGTFGILSIIGISQYFTAWPRGQGIPGEPTHYHATLFLGHHLSVASILIFPFFASLDRGWSLWTQRSAQARKKATFYFAACFFGLGALYFTYSRTLWLALPVGLLIWTLWRLPRKWAILTVVGMLVLGALALQFPLIQQRIHDALGVGPRQALWAANWEFFKSRPLAGVGWRHNHELSGYYLMEKTGAKDVFSGHAHNNFLDILGGMGVLGVLAWLGWCTVVFWALLRKKTKSLTSDLTAGWTCAWIVFHLNGLTQVNFWEAKVQHQIAWVVAWALL